FDWNNSSANPFFALFGEDFKKYAINEKNKSDELHQSIKEFMSLGLDRNRLVHQDYANFSLDKTTEEIYESYKLACYFIEWVPKALREYSSEECSVAAIEIHHEK
ncbi:HEPN domain-containing protein, partial [Neisseria dentiae]